MRTWRDYNADSVRGFLKHYTDGDIGHGGCRYVCSECGAEFSDHFAVRRCWQLYHGDSMYDDSEFSYKENAIPIEFDENGVEVE